MAKKKSIVQKIVEYFMSGNETQENISKHNKALKDAYNASGEGKKTPSVDDNNTYHKIKDSDLNQD